MRDGNGLAQIRQGRSQHRKLLMQLVRVNLWVVLPGLVQDPVTIDLNKTMLLSKQVGDRALAAGASAIDDEDATP